MSLLTSSVVISVALVGAAYLVWARFRPRVTFRGGSHRLGTTHVFDGGVDVTTQDERGASMSGYICYIRRARQKDGLPTLTP